MTRQDPNATPNPGETLVEAVKILHSIATPAAEIAKRLHVTEAVVRGVIEWGILPPMQLPLVWTDEEPEVDRFQKLRDKHGAFQLGIQDADEPQTKAPTVQHFLWWMAAVIGTGVSL